MATQAERAHLVNSGALHLRAAALVRKRATVELESGATFEGQTDGSAALRQPARETESRPERVNWPLPSELVGFNQARP